MSPRRLPTKPALPKKAPITIKRKKEIIQKYEEGKQLIDIDRNLDKASSTIATILKKKEDIKGFTVSKGVTLIASKKKWPEILNEIEKLLFVWVNKKQLMGDSIGEGLICEKGRAGRCMTTSFVRHQALLQTKRGHSRPVKAGSTNSRTGLAFTVLHVMGRWLAWIRRLQRTL